MMITPSTRLWACLRKRQKIVKDIVFECPKSHVLTSGLLQACKAFDIAAPLVLTKHERELEEFSRTSFHAHDFMEPFPYAALDIEWFEEE